MDAVETGDRDDRNDTVAGRADVRHSHDGLDERVGVRCSREDLDFQVFGFPMFGIGIQVCAEALYFSDRDAVCINRVDLFLDRIERFWSNDRDNALCFLGLLPVVLSDQARFM